MIWEKKKKWEEKMTHKEAAGELEYTQCGGRRNSILTDVRLARNMWTHTEHRGYDKNPIRYENRATWGFTYRGCRHFVEFSQRGQYGEIHAITVNERMIEKLEVGRENAWGPASYRIHLFSKHDTMSVSDLTAGEYSEGEAGENSNDNKFSCAITLVVDAGTEKTHYHLTVDGMAFEVARARWIYEHLSSNVPQCGWGQLQVEDKVTQLKQPNSELREKTWRFPYKGHRHKVCFVHNIDRLQWDILVDDKRVELYKMMDSVVMPPPTKQTTSGRGPIIRFLVAGLPCSVSVNKKDFIYWHELNIDGVPFRIYQKLVSLQQ